MVKYLGKVRWVVPGGFSLLLAGGLVCVLYPRAVGVLRDVSALGSSSVHQQPIAEAQSRTALEVESHGASVVGQGPRMNTSGYADEEYRGFWKLEANAYAELAIYVSEAVVIADPTRRQLMICIVCQLQGSDEPTGCVNSRPFVDTREVCGIGGGAYMVRITPRDNLLWADVHTKEDIVIEGDQVFR